MKKSKWFSAQGYCHKAGLAVELSNLASGSPQSCSQGRRHGFQPENGPGKITILKQARQVTSGFSISITEEFADRKEEHRERTVLTVLSLICTKD